MTASGIDPTSGVQAQYGSQSPLQQVMGAVSNELGMSQDDVRTPTPNPLDPGSTLNEYA
jgi:hypothetical protein